ncbi:hypothetical protein GS538_20315 [Rhodococcus hoagii]|nr:hypothetical protein [Prescottella equi]
MSTRQPCDVLAKHLNAVHIGGLVEFDWAFPNGVAVTVRGELRQIYHTSNDTGLSLSAPDDHSGDLREFAVQHDTPVQVRP